MTRRAGDGGSARNRGAARSGAGGGVGDGGCARGPPAWPTSTATAAPTCSEAGRGAGLELWRATDRDGMPAFTFFADFALPRAGRSPLVVDFDRDGALDVIVSHSRALRRARRTVLLPGRYCRALTRAVFQSDLAPDPASPAMSPNLQCSEVFLRLGSSHPTRTADDSLILSAAIGAKLAGWRIESAQIQDSLLRAAARLCRRSVACNTALGLYARCAGVGHVRHPRTVPPTRPEAGAQI